MGMSQSYVINRKSYTVLTKASSQEEAERTVKIYKGWLSEGHSITWKKEGEEYLILVCSPPPPPLFSWRNIR